MGYWEPPPPSVYDPAPRPLRWRRVNGAPYPELEDQKLFGIGTGSEDGAMILQWHPMSAHYRSLPNNPGIARPFIMQRTEDERIAAYGRLVDARSGDVRAPSDSDPIGGLSDPEGGGLAADSIASDGSGTVFLNYWDLSDDHRVRRKQVSYWPKREGGVGMKVMQRTDQNDGWEQEGYDAEREFSNALPVILAGFQLVTTALVGALTGSPELAALWSAALGPGVKAATTRVSPDIGDVMGSFGAFSMQALKLTNGKIDLGAIFGSPTMKSDFLQSFNGILEKFRATAAENGDVLVFADQIRAALAKGFDHFPGVNLQGALDLGAASLAPDVFAKEQASLRGIDPSNVPGSLSNEFHLAISTFVLDLHSGSVAQAASDDVVYSVRKLSLQKPIFDATYATLIAQEKRDAAFRKHMGELTDVMRSNVPVFGSDRRDPRAPLDEVVSRLKTKYGM